MTQNVKKAPTKKAAASKTSNEGQDFLKRIEFYFEKNQKAIIGILAVVLVVVGGFFGYRNFILLPKEEKASAALFPAERAFESGNYDIALNGDGMTGGALNVIKKYKGTKAGNLAYYYAGLSYLNTGDFANAIKHLEKFDGKKTPFQYLAYGALGDAYMESNNSSKGIESYKKAAQNEKDAFTAALYLFRAGVASEMAGKINDAKKYYKEIKAKYPNSEQGRNIDKYLARTGEVSLD